MTATRFRLFPLAAALSICAGAPALAQLPDPEDVTVQKIPLNGGLHMLMGMGGNIALSAGEEGIYIIDGDAEPVGEKVAAAIAEISTQPVEMLFNTHWHADHTGSNARLGQEGVTIVAHDNARIRMSTTQYNAAVDTETPAAPNIALPGITFDNTATFYVNGIMMQALHLPAAHTDSDVVFLFPEANVAHLGDIFFNKRYPMIDIDSGGSLEGMIAAVDQILPMLNEDTQIIPGHGPLATLEDLKTYRNMLALVSARIKVLIEEGKDREQVIALKPSINFDADWAWEFLPPELWVSILYTSLAGPVEEQDAD